MARLLLIVLLSGGVSAFFTPPKGVVPSADDTDAATPDRMSSQSLQYVVSSPHGWTIHPRLFVHCSPSRSS